MLRGFPILAKRLDKEQMGEEEQLFQPRPSTHSDNAAAMSPQSFVSGLAQQADLMGLVLMAHCSQTEMMTRLWLEVFAQHSLESTSSECLYRHNRHRDEHDHI